MTIPFAPLDLCQQLAALGCKPDDDAFYWREERPVYVDDHFGIHDHDVVAFHPWDFIASSEQARKNAELVFGPPPARKVNRNKCNATWCKECDPRHVIIDAEDPWSVVREALGRRERT